MADEIKLSEKTIKRWKELLKEREVAALLARDAYMRVHNMERGIWDDLADEHKINRKGDWIVDMSAGVLRRRES